MSALRHGPPLAMNGYMDKEGRKFRARKTRYFKLKDSALFNHRRKDSVRFQLLICLSTLGLVLNCLELTFQCVSTSHFRFDLFPFPFLAIIVQLPTWGVSLIDSRVAVGHKSEVIVQLFDGKKLFLYPHSRSDCDRWVDLLQRASRRKIGNYYGVTGLVGMGSFAEVRIGYDKSTGQQVAIKVMKKNKRDTELMRSVECEMNFISKNIDHENIVATYDVFDTRDNLFIVMEYMPGGMLYDILANEGFFTEKNAASVMRDLLHSVQCLHDNDIVHRDIKPENVLALNKTWPLKVKLADFGLADFVLENSFGEKSTCGMYGTPFFVAPEVIRAETYTPAVDIWSLGVLAYNMLSGKLPFDGNNIKEVLRRVRAGRYSFPDAEWGDISDEAKDFIRGLLEVDPKKRLTAREALAHSWLTSANISERAINNDRSALGYEQRKLRMSSMAIDDVAGLLRLEEEEEVADSNEHHSDHGIRALSRLFPGKSGKASRSSGSSRSRQNGELDNARHHQYTETNDNSAAVSNAVPLRLGSRGAEHANNEVSAGSHMYNAPGDLPGWNDSVAAAAAAAVVDTTSTVPRPRGSRSSGNEAEGDQDRDHSGGSTSAANSAGHQASGEDRYRGGLEFNENFVGNGKDGGFALPAILSVKDIMRRRQEALHGGVGGPGVVTSGNSSEGRRRRNGEDSSESEKEDENL